MPNQLRATLVLAVAMAAGPSMSQEPAKTTSVYMQSSKLLGFYESGKADQWAMATMYVLGVIDFSYTNPGFKQCFDRHKPSIERASKAVWEFLKKSPELGEARAALVVSMALAESFSCKP